MPKVVTIFVYCDIAVAKSRLIRPRPQGVATLYIGNRYSDILAVSYSTLNQFLAHLASTASCTQFKILAICRPSGCTVVSSVVVVGICNCCQMRTVNVRLIFGVSIGLDPG